MDERPGATATVLFTDVEGSTELRTRLGDEAAHEILRRQEGAVRDAIERHGASHVKALGDGFMAAFGSARVALACAVEIQRAVIEDEAGGTADGPRVRVGLNAGEVRVESGDLFGAAVNAAARIAAKARGGQILTSGLVCDLAGTLPGVEFFDRGLYWLKGFPDRWRLFEVDWRDLPDALRLPSGPSDRTAFVGREEERAELRRLVESAAAGRGGIALIGGEPGVGKTRIAEEAAEEASGHRMLALIGHCTDMEGAPPYLPFVEILEEAFRRVSEETFREAFGDATAEVARLVPEIRARFPDLPPPADLPPDQARRYLWGSVREVLDRAGRMQPLLLVLDDLHWADESTLLLLLHLAPALPEMPVLVIGTYRDVELDVSRPLARAIEDLTRRRLAKRISLRRLPQDGVRDMLRALAGQEPPEALVAVVYEETEGNPFFVEEVFRHLSEEGRLLDERGSWRTDLSIDELDVPEGVRLVIGRRLERLSEAGRGALAVAAVIGRTFRFDVLSEAADLDADDLVDAIEEAERARLLVSSDEGNVARFSFSHELVRQTLLTGLTMLRRQRQHLKVADALETIHRADLGEHASDLVHHLTQAGAGADPERLARFLGLAADRALDAAAYEQALRYVDTAMELLGPDAVTGARAALLDRRGKALQSLGRFDETVEVWNEALEGYTAADDMPAVLDLSYRMALHYGWASRWTESLAAAQRGLVASGGDEGMRSSLLAFGGLLLGLGGAFDEGLATIEEGQALAERIGDSDLVGAALAARTIHHWGYAQVKETIEYGERAAQILGSTGARWQLMNMLPFILWAYSYSGQFEDSARIGAELEPEASRLGHYGALSFAMRERTLREFEADPDLDRMLKRHDEDLEICLRSGNENLVGQSHSWMGMTRFWRGEMDEALERLAEGTRLEANVPGVFNGLCLATELLLRARLGYREDAVRVLEENAHRLPRAGAVNPWGSWAYAACAVEARMWLGDREGTASLGDAMREFGELGIRYRFFDGRMIDGLVAVAAAAGGDWEEAEARFAAGLATAERFPFPVETHDLRALWAHLLLAWGGPSPDRARGMLEQAVEGYTAIGMPWHVEKAQTLLSSVD